MKNLKEYCEENKINLNPCWFDKQGKAIDSQEAEKLLSDDSYKIVKQDIIGKYFVSTVWLGFDHNFHLDYPIIFETMVFYCKKDRPDFERDDIFMARYRTEKEALKGHKAVCKLAKKDNFQ